jgi:hypothetical protein
MWGLGTLRLVGWQAVKVFTDPDAAVARTRIDGRRIRHWAAVIGLVVLVNVLASMVSHLIGADQLFAEWFDDQTTSGTLHSALKIAGFSVLLQAMGYFAVWAALPFIASLFRGSRLRLDATLATYLSLCAAIPLTLAMMCADLIGVGLQRAAPPLGIFWVAAFLIGLIGLATHFMARIVQYAHGLRRYRYGLLVALCALVLFLVAAITAMVVVMVTIGLPDGFLS